MQDDYEKSVEKRAKEKLARIIEKYGDSKGERLKCYYLEDLKHDIRFLDEWDKLVL